MPIMMTIWPIRTQIGPIRKIVYVVTGTINPPDCKPISVIAGNRMSMEEAIAFYKGEARDMVRTTLSKHGYVTV